MHPQGLSIGDFLSSGDSKWLYRDRNAKTEELAEELRAESSSNEKKYEKPFVERLDSSEPPSNLKAEVGIHVHTEKTSKIAGVWESVKVCGVHSLEVMTSHFSFSAPGDLYSDFSAFSLEAVPRAETRKPGDIVALRNREGTSGTWDGSTT